jgi:NADPH:quinone reductase-like Zn-dependent oxidoreductase
MRVWTMPRLGIDGLQLVDRPAAGDLPENAVRVEIHAFSLNFRDFLVVTGAYNPKMTLPATPISDAAGVVTAVGSGVTRWKVGDRVMSHFISGWIDGPYEGRYQETSLGTPGPGLAAEEVVLPESALVRIPDGYSFAEASTLPIAALTAWSALFTEGHLQPGQTAVTLGTGGVSIFALQLAKAAGARVIITSSSDGKLERAKSLGADVGINYRTKPDWDKEVLAHSDGGAHVVVENGGAGTLNRSMRAARPGGRVALLGVLSGGQAEIQTTLILMKRLTICGIYVDSRANFEKLSAFLTTHRISPVIDREFAFEEFPQALRTMERGEHFGKLVVRVR